MNYCKNHGKSSGKLPGVISKQAIHMRTMSSRIMPFIFNMDAYPDQTKHRMWDDACSNLLQLFRQIYFLTIQIGLLYFSCYSSATLYFKYNGITIHPPHPRTHTPTHTNHPNSICKKLLYKKKV